MAKEFPEDLNPIPTPLTGSERVLADKGTATIDDVKAFARTGLPAPSAASDAATKGYVDARPGAEEWSEHPATQDVDMDGHAIVGLPQLDVDDPDLDPLSAANVATVHDVASRLMGQWAGYPATHDVDLDGHKLTGLGEPTDAADAATKGYVDDRSHIGESGTHWGRWDGGAQSLPNGASDRNPLSGAAYARLQPGDTAILVDGTTVTMWWCISTGGEGASPPATWRPISPKWDTAAGGGTPSYNYLSVSFETNLASGVARRRDVGDWYYVSGDAHARSKRLTNLGAPVNNSDAATKKYVDDRHVVEWWTPSWTPVENVDSVSNVECSYTRTYRAAGGSLVTLEGTITVESLGAGQCVVQVDLPIARVGSSTLAGTAMVLGGGAPPVVAVASVDSTTLTLSFDAEGAGPHGVPFRISYRAA